ncbi:ribonuclease DdI precursor, putative [Entamoeba invadens IP1]|uniref:Ribonuclease DdI, putative n=1 Tax=Entamoeba invadens IP1 TaxID=370355 RepID=L7FMX7_ENTIV|nr:ribonuclease DdI precursor, putative [Entamoeba invadens IP1]ELP90955.1 ribonuclease DdI precursor, putative [Entamoeba invadens IP1]|eukprot:XP_004257726.1 ribonuclease DdI precursor, putative [Entamoeba invadens IP1]
MIVLKNKSMVLLLVLLYFLFTKGQPDKPKEPEKQSEASGTTFPSLEPLRQALPSSDEQVVRRRVPRTQQQQAQPTPLKFQLHPSTIKKLDYYQPCKTYYAYTKKFDYMLFVQYWPGGRCYDFRCSLPLKTPFVKEGFWLHGLWPQKRQNRNIYCCRNNFNIYEIERRLQTDPLISQDIHKYWMSVDNCRLALYQFDKHGTCALTAYQGSNGPYDYIWTAINLWKRIDIWKILKNSHLNIKTEELYDIEKLREIISNVYKGKVAFMCKEMTSIIELRICVNIKGDKFNPEVIDCPEKILKEEEKKCSKMVLFKNFPTYLLDPSTAPRNDCPY